MQAIVYRRFGSPDELHLEEVAKLSPRDNEVLISVQAASPNVGDWRALRGTPLPVRLMLGPIKPRTKILGGEVAGRVEAVGAWVTRFKVSDEVFGDAADGGRGAFAEFMCAREDMVALKPANATFEEAATVSFGAGTALFAFRKANLQAGQRVLVNGASGGVGMAAVQIAKSLGAEVTGVCSAGKMELARSIGADHVIDYGKEDFTGNGQRYDLIIDCAAYRSVFTLKRSLTPKGTYVMVGGKEGMGSLLQAMLVGPFIGMTGGPKMGYIGMTKATREDMETIRGLLADGKLTTVIDKRFPLSETAEAFRYYEAGRVVGRVVINVGGGG
jgi:NADPH:quinone reductase-like Zn-dependent oxidoreductase